MASFRVQQVRSGEGWILTDIGNVGPEVLASDLSDLCSGVLLVSSEDLDDRPPAGAERVQPGLFALRGDAARQLLRDWTRWGARRAIFACVPAVPDEDARRRWIADPRRPWDAERLKASVYGQLGSQWAQRGLWFATERDRERFVEAGVTKLLGSHGTRLPNGDVTIVLELPTDSTFDAEFKVSGSGESLSLRREFPSREMSREWVIRRGEWEATERRATGSAPGGWRARLTQRLASAAILVMSIPVFVMVLVVWVVAKLSGSATTVSTSAKATSR